MTKERKPIVQMCQGKNCCPSYFVSEDGYLYITDDFDNEVKVDADREAIIDAINKAFESFELVKEDMYNRDVSEEDVVTEEVKDESEEDSSSSSREVKRKKNVKKTIKRGRGKGSKK